MRFLDLEVKNFQAIASARVEFSPQLNVLYGPNDLGKSTLVTALRAALLVPARSSEGSDWVSWYRDAIPRVTLTLEDDTGRFWRVVKEFGEGRGSAELSSSKDGEHFSVEAKAREVDERLRKLLEWGLPEARGRGGSDTFLANALLAGQADVDAILDKQLGADGSDSGKARLTRALAALAQDPLFKVVLEQAQAELGQYFTATGRKRSGARTRFAIVGEQVKTLTDELSAAKTQLDQAAATEAQVARLRNEVDAARAREREATSLVEQARAGMAQARERAIAEERVSAARVALRRIDEVASKAATLADEVRSLEGRVGAEQAALAQADERVTSSQQQARSAEEAVGRAQSEQGARERELKRATLKSRLAELEASIARLEPQRDKAKAALEAQRALQQADEQFRRLDAEVRGLDAQLAEARTNLELSRAIQDYGRWKDAERTAASASGATDQATQLEATAKTLEARVATLRAEQAQRLAALEASLSKLPSKDQATAFEKIERDRQSLESQLSGGLSVVVRGREELRLHVDVDDDEPVDEVLKANKERAFDAERRVALSVGQMLELEIVSGSKQVRQMRDQLSKRWKAEVVPALTAAEVGSVGELLSRHQALAAERVAITQLSSDAEHLAVQAASASAQAVLLRRQGAQVESAEALARRRDRIPKAQLEIIAKMFDSLGTAWESQADALVKQHDADVERLSGLVSKRQAELAVVEERRRSLPRSDVTPATLDALEAELARAAKERQQAQLGLQALEAEQGNEVKAAQRALEVARTSSAAAEQTRAAVARQLEALRATVHERKGQHAAVTAELERLDRPAAQRALATAEAAFAPLANLVIATPESLAQAEQLLAQLRAITVEHEAEFNRADGALSKVGGPQQRERVRQLEEALQVAKAREQEVELDAESWRLLQETLREAENAEGGHLGRALAGPISSAFRELTQGRYGALELGPELSTLALSAEGAETDGASVLAALSVGTRDQLASLLRVAIARQLKSALVLDDHLVHTDASRMSWFVDALRKTALDAQVIVVTCRPLDYVPAASVGKAVVQDLGGGSLRAIDLGKTIETWPERRARDVRK